MSDVYVLGTDMIRFGRFPDRSVPEIGAQAALMALDDAGLTVHDMEALYCCNLFQASNMVGQRILQEIGQTGIPVVNCSNACATGATAFREGWMAIKAGAYDLVLVDADKDGRISQAEFIAAHPDKAEQFAKMDANQDGFVDEAERKAWHAGKGGEGNCAGKADEPKAGEGKCGEGKCGEGGCGASA